jgi:hypothetical protein
VSGGRDTTTTYDRLVARVGDLVGALDRPPVVGVSGHGGAGRTTLATRLAADLGLEPRQVVELGRSYAAGARGPAVCVTSTTGRRCGRCSRA